MTCRGLDTIVGVLEANSLMNFTFGVLGAISFSKYEVIITRAKGMSMGIVAMMIRLIERT